MRMTVLCLGLFRQPIRRIRVNVSVFRALESDKRRGNFCKTPTLCHPICPSQRFQCDSATHFATPVAQSVSIKLFLNSWEHFILFHVGKRYGGQTVAICTALAEESEMPVGGEDAPSVDETPKSWPQSDMTRDDRGRKVFSPCNPTLM